MKTEIVARGQIKGGTTGRFEFETSDAFQGSVHLTVTQSEWDETAKKDKDTKKVLLALTVEDMDTLKAALEATRIDAAGRKK